MRKQTATECDGCSEEKLCAWYPDTLSLLCDECRAAHLDSMTWNDALGCWTPKDTKGE